MIVYNLNVYPTTMTVLTLSLDDSKYFKIHPKEDSLGLSNNIFAIADGITRDPIGNLDFSQFSKEELGKAYPNPSPAKQAADLFVKSFIEFSESSEVKNLDTVKLAFKNANEQIKKLNIKNNPHPDYLDKDYWACVACAGLILDSTLYWGSIDDCKVKVFGSEFELKLDSPNNHEVFENYFHYLNNSPNGFDWNKPEWRKYVRKEFRNNANKIVDGKLVSYGALTGEDSALDFISYGEMKLSKGDYVLFYSDGFEDLVNSDDFKNLLIESNKSQSIEAIQNKSEELGLVDWRKFGRERSMILIII